MFVSSSSSFFPAVICIQLEDLQLNGQLIELTILSIMADFRIWRGKDEKKKKKKDFSK
jgi:hypothetical protein